MSPACTLAVMKTAGAFTALSRFRSCRKVDGPSTSGIITSSSNRSGAKSSTTCNASAQDSQAATLYSPTNSSDMLTILRMSASSSTYKIFCKVSVAIGTHSADACRPVLATMRSPPASMVQCGCILGNSK